MSASSAYVVYRRVSTSRQGESGLGLAAQEAAVSAFLQAGDAVLSTFTEVESGRNCQRPQLHAALAEARRRKAVLLIAKLDRLSRNVAFLATLLEGDVPIVAADNPHATKFTLHILAACAQHEAELCSIRTKAALQAAKSRGTVLGGYRGVAPTKAAGEKGRAVRSSLARARAVEIAPAIEAARKAGAATASAIARMLNDQGLRAHGGGAWSPVQVQRVLSRLAA
jgi:DNA invertase Pin-like site-specific DNA recombinase